jgi:hypothetical protein
MKKMSAVILLLVSLSMPALASPRGDDSPSNGPIQRIVRVVRHLVVHLLDDSWSVNPPKP